MSEVYSGRCLCKAVSFEIEGPDLTCVNCHCESCRRQCSAPMTTYVGVADGKWRWTGAQPKVFESSPGVERSFCEQCGTPMSFCSKTLSGVMHVYLAALENPNAISPSAHVAYEEKLDWFSVTDELPKHNGPSYL